MDEFPGPWQENKANDDCEDDGWTSNGSENSSSKGCFTSIVFLLVSSSIVVYFFNF